MRCRPLILLPMMLCPTGLATTPLVTATLSTALRTAALRRLGLILLFLFVVFATAALRRRTLSCISLAGAGCRERLIPILALVFSVWLTAAGGISTRCVRLACHTGIPRTVLCSLERLPGMMSTASSRFASRARVCGRGAGVRVSGIFVADIHSPGMLIVFPTVGLPITIR